MKASVKSKSIFKRSMIGALILALLGCLLFPSLALAASTIVVGVTPGLPSATAIGGTVTFNFSVTYETTPAYVVLYVDNINTNSEFCYFYDMNGLFGTTWNTHLTSGSCYYAYTHGYTTAYFDVHPQPAGNPGSPKTYSQTGITWTIPSGFTIAAHTLNAVYVYDAGGGTYTSESGGFIDFNVATSTTTITLRKFYDKNANGVYDGSDSYATSPQFNLCLTDPYGDYNCKLSDSSTGEAIWNSMATGTYTFEETAQSGWGRTTPTYNDPTAHPTDYQDTVTSSPYYLEFGNAQSDMVCDSVAVTSPLSGANQMTYRLNYEKLYNGITAKNPTVKLYFTTSGLNHPISWTYISSTVVKASGDGSSGTPYLFNLSDITTAGTGYIDVVIELTFTDGNRPTTGNFNAFQVVGSTYEPVLPNNNTCSKTIPFNGTAVNASSFAASPQAGGIQLSWLANPAGTDWVGFKLQSKPHASALYADVPGAFIPADLGAVGLSHYSYLDASAQPGLIDYQLLPVKSGGVEQPAVLSLTTGYDKVYIPNILK